MIKNRLMMTNACKGSRQGRNFSRTDRFIRTRTYSWVEGFCECTNLMYFYMHSSMSLVRCFKTQNPPSSGLSVIILEPGCPLGERGPCLTKGSRLPKVFPFNILKRTACKCLQYHLNTYYEKSLSPLPVTYSAARKKEQ